MTETELVTSLCAAIHRARYPDADSIEKVRALINSYVVTAVQACLSAYFEKTNAKMLEQLKAHVDQRTPVTPSIGIE